MKIFPPVAKPARRRPTDRQSRPTCSRPDRLQDVQRLLMSLLSCPDMGCRRKLVGSIVWHPSVLGRLRAARAKLFRRLPPRHREFWSDVLHQSAVSLGERLLTGSLSYRDEGSARFRSWLFAVCYSACIDAWNKCRPLSTRAVVLIDGRVMNRLLAPDEPNGSRAQLLELIEFLDSDLLRRVFEEWLDGATISESAAKRGIGLATVFRLRDRVKRVLLRAGCEPEKVFRN